MIECTILSDSQWNKWTALFIAALMNWLLETTLKIHFIPNLMNPLQINSANLLLVQGLFRKQIDPYSLELSKERRRKELKILLSHNRYLLKTTPAVIKWILETTLKKAAPYGTILLNSLPGSSLPTRAATPSKALVHDGALPPICTVLGVFSHSLIFF
jgi:hypothetical protein